MNSALKAAIIEAFATAKNVVYLNTLQVSHPLVAESLYLVRDREDHDLTLETAEVVTFKACGFKLALPTSGEDGVQEISIAIDNVDRQVSDFVDLIKDSIEPAQLTFRPYLATDPTTPQMDPPLVLFLSGASFNVFEATGKASFADILNKMFLAENYTRAEYPSLAN